MESKRATDTQRPLPRQLLLTKETPQPRGGETRNQGRRDRWAPPCAPPPRSAEAQPGFCGFLPQNAYPRSNHDENSGPNLRTFYKIAGRVPRKDQERRRGRPRWKTPSSRSARGVGPGARGPGWEKRTAGDGRCPSASLGGGESRYSGDAGCRKGGEGRTKRCTSSATFLLV